MNTLWAYEIAALPLPYAAFIMIGVPLLIAMLVGVVLSSFFTPQEFAENAFMVSMKFSFVVQVYAVVAALTLVGAWDIYQTSRDQVQRETGALYLLAHAADSYTRPEQEAPRNEMRSAIRNYASSVAFGDWPHMQAGVPSNTSDAAYTRLARAFMDVEPVTAAQQAIAQNTPDWLAKVAEARIGRLSVGTRTLSQFIWFLCITISVSVLSFQWLFTGTNQVVQIALGAGSATIVGAVLLVALKLSYPFIGSPALLSPSPFFQLMELT